MVKHIKLDIDNEKFFALKRMKAYLESAQRENMTWEEFLVDWVLHVNDMLTEKGVDKTFEKLYLEIKPETRKKFEKSIRDIVMDKLRYSG